MPLAHLGSQEMLATIIDNQAKTFTYPLELALFVQAAGGAGVAPNDNPTSGTEGTDPNEVNPGSAYARFALIMGTATAASPSAISNTNTLAYTQATAQWGSTTNPTGFIGGWVIYDAHVTTPKGVWVGAFNTAKQVQNLDTVSVAIGDLTLQLD